MDLTIESRQRTIFYILRKWASADGLQSHPPFYPYIMDTKDLKTLLDLYGLTDLSDEQREEWVRLQNTWGKGIYYPK